MESKFTGGVFAGFFYMLSVYVVSVLTLGLGYPFIICRYQNWEAKHTYINGLQKKFTGSASVLFKKYIVWWTLSVLTLGVYFVVKTGLNVLSWKIENSGVEGREEKSYFKAEWYQLLGAKAVANFIKIITLGIGYAWAYCYYREWLCRHTYINGNKLDFLGEGRQYFFKLLGWSFLTDITLGIYGFWFYSNAIRWRAEQTSFMFKEGVIAGKLVLVKRPVPVLPEPVAAVDKPVMGERFKRIYDFMAVKRAMICFSCEIPFLVGAVPAMAFTIGTLTYVIAPLLMWFVVLLSLPAIFLVEERFKNIGELKLKNAMAFGIIGLILSVAVFLFVPVFIYGLTEAVRLKKWIYGEEKISENSALTDSGKAVIPEQEIYFETAKKYQVYLWDCSNYKKALKRYAKDIIGYNEELKAYNDAVARYGFAKI